MHLKAYQKATVVFESCREDVIKKMSDIDKDLDQALIKKNTL
jgi:hypothetical protein